MEVPENDADKAITACNGQEFRGRALVVNEARPMAERPERSGSGGGRAFAANGGGGGSSRRRTSGGGADRDFGRGRDRRY